MYVHLAACVISLSICANTSDSATGQSPLNTGKNSKALDALANSNAEPTIVKDNRSRPMFAPTYNFREQDRVLQAIDGLIKNAERLWPTLLEGVSDRRYCVTLGNLYSASNYTIGNTCYAVLAETLTAAYRPHIPKTQLSFSALQSPDIVRREDFIEWCKDRHSKGAKLYELQIEMCHWALAKTAKLDPIQATDEEKAASIKAIQAQIDLLSTTKKPAVMRSIVSQLRYPFSK